MASSSPSVSSTRPMFLSSKSMVVVFFILLLLGSCGATRPGCMMGPVGESSNVPEPVPERKQEPGYRGEALVLNMLPKGTPIPPSGPSQRHN
ncbi:hypothetical protein NMG60_11036075 [Bertholletia excelsa]